MMMPTKSRKKILTKLFQDGVMFAKKDPALLKHPEFPEIPNLHVMKLMQSLKSKDHVTEVFAWQHYYWTLTDAGVESLRETLHLPATIVPSTHKKAATETARLPMSFGGERGPREGGRAERDGYRGKPAFGGSVRGRGTML